MLKMVNEKEFKKYIKQVYYNRKINNVYLATFVLFVIIIITFFFIISVETEVPPIQIQPTIRVNSISEAIAVTNEIKEDFAETNLLLNNLENIVSKP